MFEFFLAMMVIIFLLACCSCHSTPYHDKMFRNHIAREVERTSLPRSIYDNLFVVGGVRYPVK